MTTDLDNFEFDSERSRATVAVACLKWLGCTGPTVELGVAKEITPDVADPVRDLQPIEVPIHAPNGSPHPLWDRWLDG